MNGGNEDRLVIKRTNIEVMLMSHMIGSERPLIRYVIRLEMCGSVKTASAAPG